LENVVPPVPGDTVVVFSAYLVGRGIWDIAPVFATTVGGGVIGFMFMFFMGMRYGRSLFEARGGRVFTYQGLQRAESWLARYGFWLILANRFMTGVRSVVAISAGLGKMSPVRVLFAGVLSMMVWNGLLLYVGLLLGQNWGEVSELLRQYNRVLLGVFVLGIGILFVRRWLKA
jgi:membrane protein DedA with SNARE-associated domain